MCHHAIDRDQRTRRADTARGEHAGLQKIFRELLAKEAGRRNEVIRAAEPLRNEITQTAAYRLANQQRARQHRDRNRDAEHYHDVRLPVVSEAALYQASSTHHAGSRCWLRSSKRWGKRAARSALCVTTIRIVFACACM